MVGKECLCIVSILLLLVVTLPTSSAPRYIHTRASDSPVPSAQDSAIVILSDDDFEEQGWPGNGTPDDPYLLSDLIIEAYYECVIIYGTNAHFVIRDSVFESSSTAHVMLLSELSNGVIDNCTISGTGYEGIYINCSSNVIVSNSLIYGLHDEGICIEYCSNVTVTNNLIHGCACGILLLNSRGCTLSSNSLTLNIWAVLSSSFDTIIQSNSITYNDFSLHLGSDARNNTIRFNKMAGGMYGIRMSYNSANNSFYGNKVGSNSDYNAWDNGVSNQWDDNAGLGNAWDDYNGTGVYSIHGAGGSVDRHPSILSEDVLGPNITAAISWGLCIDLIYAPATFGFEATVTDATEVDTVLISANDMWYEMNHSPTAEEPDLYTCGVPFQVGGYYYYYWANDTCGNVAMTHTGFISVGVLGHSSSPSTTTTIGTGYTQTYSTTDLPPIEIPAFAIGVFTAIALAVLYVQHFARGKEL